jgi:UDP-glucose 4-epimerase
MNVLVTGGAGFIGSHLVRHHLALGDRVTAVDNLSTGSAANVAPFLASDRFRFEDADIVAWPGLDDAVARADRIYHLAAVVGMFHVLDHPVDVTRVNVLGCERVLDAAVRSGRRPQIVLASSSSVYGGVDPEDMHEDAIIRMAPRSPLLDYALSKFTNEVQGAAYAHEHGLPVVAVRLFNTIGPGQAGLYGFVVPRFVQQAIAGAPITVFGDGSQTRSFCDVRDTVAMLDALALAAPPGGTVVNLGNASEVSILELAELVRSRARSASPIEFVPYAKAYGRAFDVIPQRRPALARLHGLIGVRPRWTLEATIDDLIGHYGRAGAHASSRAPATASAGVA